MTQQTPSVQTSKPECVMAPFPDAAAVSPGQAAEDVRREKLALANSDKVWPQPDGFINDYD